MSLRVRAVEYAAVLSRLQWARGLRAGLAVSTAMVLCHALGRPMGWAALGGFEAILVDNGGPYRTRLTTMVTLMAGGAAACVIASMAATPAALACAAAAVFCFAVTFARVLAQPIASTGVIILVIYFAEVGATAHTLSGALHNALDFVLGGAWAAALSLVLWPVDPFRPARRAVAASYTQLADFAAGIRWTPPHTPEREAMRLHTHRFQRSIRVQMEAARVALGTTAARSTSRTVRARNLTVLLETADILYAETLRWTELFEQASASDAATRQALEEAVHWLSGAELAIAAGLQHRPGDGGASFAPEGSHSLEHVRGRAAIAQKAAAARQPLLVHLGAEERDALQNVEIAFEAVRAVWSGLEARGVRSLDLGQAPESGGKESGQVWMRGVDAVRSNWTLDSVVLRHASRVGLVAGVDVLLMRALRVHHGSWLAMTSIIVLQPYGSGTLRKSAQRVGGTIAGGILAAALAASIHSQAGIIAVITVTSIMTLATYAVDYGWYAFFLTPTFVLMSLPHLRDWRYAGVRMGTTVVGALIAVLAMRLLWPEREEVQLGRLLGRAAVADAAYLRAIPRFWKAASGTRPRAERAVLAPVRREAGLRILDAEETLDRLMLEPGYARMVGGSVSSSENRTAALTFITYLRRLARAATTLAAAGMASDQATSRMETLAARLDAVGQTLLGESVAAATAAAKPLPGSREAASGIREAAGVGEQQLQRIERQVGVLERTVSSLAMRRENI